MPSAHALTWPKDAPPPRPDDPQVVALGRACAGHPAAAASLWTEAYLADDVDPARFRADNAYLWQERDGVDGRAFLLTAPHVAARDRLGLLARLREDGAFGVTTARVGGRLVSRDLLDSVLELNVLDAALGGLDGRLVLDIGAGYGRLAWRLTEAFPAARVLATDGVPYSSALAAWYLAHRRAAPRAEVLSLPRVSARLAIETPDVAVNIHSFTEMPRAAAAWWIQAVASAGVRWLFIVPNADDHGGEELACFEPDGTRSPLLPVLAASGFRCVLDQPKYSDATVQRYGISPTRHLLFERAP
jgi:hypothetical protein